MQGEQGLMQQLKYQLNNGTMTFRLIFINVAVFLLIKTIEVIGGLISGEISIIVVKFLDEVFTLHTDLNQFIWKPWGLITSMFSHFGFLHILFNMVFLYFVGTYFEQVFDKKRLLYTYLLAGLAGGIIEILARLAFPGLEESIVVVGASGAIMGVFIALAFNQPRMTVNLFGVLKIRLIFLALIYLVIDYVSLGQQDGTAHFAHLGGALIGFISIQNLYSRSNIVTAFGRFGDAIGKFFSKIFGIKKKKLTVIHRATGKTYKSDTEYNQDAKARQQSIDLILDKISKSGYNSLNKEEKEFLFKESNK